MDRRTALKLIAATPLVFAPSMVRAAEYSDAAWRKAIVIDGLGAPSDPDYVEGRTRYTARGRAELASSGITAINCTVAEPGNIPNAFELAVGGIAELDRTVADNGDLFVKATRAADILAAKRDGKVALVCGFQDTTPIGPQLDRITLFKSLGVRIIQLTYNRRNLCGDGALEAANAGLSTLGHETIAALEKAAVLLDLSHGGQRTIAEAIAASKRPMTISHTGCRDLHDNPRNVRDAELKAMADKGGVAGIFFMPFLAPSGKPTREDLIRHLDHAVNVCGEDHVSIGTDGGTSAIVIDDKMRAEQKKFYEQRAAQGIAAPGEGPDVFNYVGDYNSPLRFRMLADDLTARGWKAARVEKVLGANLMRLWGDSWGG
ncbi:MAG: membrane dipeptidase [Pseudomonadota bacterium]|uniref:dipeptidase n=1 Tax=Sphingomonas sp. ERG5 TaxID=1381597 RepID=UPI00054B2C67|nr:membrane dipeptidase [Sphingomonas sp. ERG5]